MAELNDINEILEDVIAGLNSQVELNKLGLAGITRIKDRTLKGLDVDGRVFQTYSGRWAKIRKKNELPTHPVDLRFSDIEGMLQKIDHTVSNNLQSVAIDIDDPEKKQIASYHDELGAGSSKVVRHFWGLNKDDETAISNLVARDLENLLNKLVSEKQ